MPRYTCRCKDCKVARRSGLTLGSRKMGFWISDSPSGEPEYYYGSVSDYVPCLKFQKGRRRKDSTRRPYKHKGAATALTQRRKQHE